MANIILSAFADEYAPELEGQIEVLKKFGIKYLEVRFVNGVNIASLERDEVTALKDKLFANGIGVNSIGSPIGKVNTDADMDAELARAEKVFEYANILGAKYIRMFSFYPVATMSDEENKRVVYDTLSRLLDLADKYGVILCHENEAKIYGESPERCLELFEFFGGRLKCVFDMGNFVLDGYKPYPDGYELLREYIAYFHIKDSFAAGAIVPAGCGEAHIADILAAHKEYSGEDFFITLEPHLQTFSGLNALVAEGKTFENPYKYPDLKSAFCDGAQRLISILENKGQMEPIKSYYQDELKVNIYSTRSEMGKAAANDISAKIKECLAAKDEISMIFAAAPSQNEVLASLVADKSIEWNRVNAYHMDEYLGLDATAPQRFGNFLSDHIFSLVPFKSVNYIGSDAPDVEGECQRYGDMLKDAKVDIVVMGIGENGHIAFNDPPVANFNDKVWVKPVKLDDICRQQQVNDGCFAKFDDVPEYALSLTVPALMAPDAVFCIVPAKTKAWAVKETLTGSIDEHCPATVLRTKKGAILYVETDSASMIL